MALPPPVAVQLYSLRDAAAADFPGVLRRVGAMGYAGVELAGFHDVDPTEVGRVLADVGLRVASAHVGLDPADQYEAALDVHQALGADTVVVPFLAPDDFATADAVARAADRINAAHEITSARSLTLGYHNHWWELEHSIDGRPGLLALFDRLAPDVVAEVDIYWAQVGGTDPTVLLGELGNRAAFLHVKDGPADEPGSPMVAVGDGAIDVPTVLAAAPSARWHIVELDQCATDMEVAVARSHDFLVGAGLSSGAPRRADA
jgi:sugar phosphate isomerase/epimerase